MITLMEDTDDNTHGGDIIMITFMEETCDYTQGRDM